MKQEMKIVQAVFIFSYRIFFAICTAQFHASNLFGKLYFIRQKRFAEECTVVEKKRFFSKTGTTKKAGYDIISNIKVE